MTTGTITRIATAAAATAIVGMSVTLAAPANAINKHDTGGGNGTPARPAQLVQPANHSHDLDPAQIAAGALGGITLAGVGFATTVRLRHNRSTPTPA